MWCGNAHGHSSSTTNAERIDSGTRVFMSIHTAWHTQQMNMSSVLEEVLRCDIDSNYFSCFCFRLVNGGGRRGEGQQNSACDLFHKTGGVEVVAMSMMMTWWAISGIFRTQQPRIALKFISLVARALACLIDRLCHVVFCCFFCVVVTPSLLRPHGAIDRLGGTVHGAIHGILKAAGVAEGQEALAAPQRHEDAD